MSLLFGLLHTLENSVRIKKKQRLHQIHIIRTRYNFKFTVTTRRFVATDRTFACPMFLWSKLESVLQCWAPPVNIFSRSSFSDNIFSFSIRHGMRVTAAWFFLAVLYHQTSTHKFVQVGSRPYMISSLRRLESSLSLFSFTWSLVLGLLNLTSSHSKVSLLGHKLEHCHQKH